MRRIDKTLEELLCLFCFKRDRCPSSLQDLLQAIPQTSSIGVLEDEVELLVIFKTAQEPDYIRVSIQNEKERQDPQQRELGDREGEAKFFRRNPEEAQIRLPLCEWLHQPTIGLLLYEKKE